MGNVESLQSGLCWIRVIRFRVWTSGYRWGRKHRRSVCTFAGVYVCVLSPEALLLRGWVYCFNSFKCFCAHRDVLTTTWELLTTVFSGNTLAHFPKTIQREFITLKGGGTGAQDQGRSFNTLLFLSCPRRCSPQFRACNLHPHLPSTSGGRSTQYFSVSNFVPPWLSQTHHTSSYLYQLYYLFSNYVVAATFSRPLSDKNTVWTNELFLLPQPLMMCIIKSSEAVKKYLMCQQMPPLF